MTYDSPRRDLLLVGKAFSDASRLRILRFLQGRELCVCQVTAALGLAPSTVSKHLFLLTQARLIDGRKRGRWIYYRLAGEAAPPFIREALGWLRFLARGPEAAADGKRLKAVLRIKPEDLCGKRGLGGDHGTEKG